MTQPHHPVIQTLPVEALHEEMADIRAELGDYQDSSDVEADAPQAGLSDKAVAEE